MKVNTIETIYNNEVLPEQTTFEDDYNLVVEYGKKCKMTCN